MNDNKTGKRILRGTVTSDKMDKTVVVTVARIKKHPKYGKYFHASRRFKAHDEKNEYKTGDFVAIEETRPLSREKRWRVVGIAKKEQYDGGAVKERENAEPKEDENLE